MASSAAGNSDTGRTLDTFDGRSENKSWSFCIGLLAISALRCFSGIGEREEVVDKVLRAEVLEVLLLDGVGSE